MMDAIYDVMPEMTATMRRAFMCENRLPRAGGGKALGMRGVMHLKRPRQIAKLAGREAASAFG